MLNIVMLLMFGFLFRTNKQKTVLVVKIMAFLAFIEANKPLFVSVILLSFVFLGTHFW